MNPSHVTGAASSNISPDAASHEVNGASEAPVRPEETNRKGQSPTRSDSTAETDGPTPSASTPPSESTTASGGQVSVSAEAGRDLLLLLQSFATESSRYADSIRKHYGLAHNDVHAITEVMQGQRRGTPLRAGDIARRLVISASAATAVIDRLVHRGHLERQSDADDRREVVLAATSSAAATGRAMFLPMVEELMAEIETWEDNERNVLRRRIPELTEAIVRAQGRTPPSLGEEVGAEDTDDAQPGISG